MKNLIILILLFLSIGCHKYGVTSAEDNLLFRNFHDFLFENYYKDGGNYKAIYIHNQLILRNFYDSTDILEYQTPFDTKLLTKTSIYLVSGRKYLRQNEDDTIVIFNKGVPSYNQRIAIYGAGLKRLTDSSFIIRPNKDTQALNVRIKYSVCSNIEQPDGSENFIDSTQIPVN